MAKLNFQHPSSNMLIWCSGNVIFILNNNEQPLFCHNVKVFTVTF